MARASDGTGHASPRRRSWTRRLLRAQESGLVIVILLMMAGLTFFGGTKEVRVRDQATGEILRDASGRPVEREVNRFLDAQNLVLLTTNASYIAVMAVGMTAVIALAGIDLSVGSLYALTGVVASMVLKEMDPAAGALLSVPVAFLLCMGIGTVCGVANGVMIVGLRVHPFIITLGTMAIFRGVAFVMSSGQTITGVPESLQQDFIKLEVLGLRPVLTVLMIMIALAGTFILTRTVIGRQVFAIGGNETAARYAGVPVGRVKIIVYAAMGLLAGIAAFMVVGYYGAAQSNAGQAYELRVIAAAVIGGASLAGGRGSAIGAVLGAVVIEMIQNGMLILGIDTSYTEIVLGVAIILAVVVDQSKAKFLQRG
ncbi:MAG: ABC transporter permease [Phycisphaerales bacterium]|nr:ABC transporter permease [Phycisphaerales bacterium]